MSDDSLMSRLRDAAEGSRELSDEVLLALGWKRAPSWRSPDGKVFPHAIPNPTVSLDDAVALVGTKYQWTIEEGLAWLHWLDDSPDGVAEAQGYVRVGEHRTPRAICIALLIASEERKVEDAE